MSGRSGASGSVRSCGGSVRLGTAGGHEVVLDALYERKRDKKSVRVLTVIIYVFCVSLAAIMLSLYYVFFWEPKDAQYAQRKVVHTVDQQTSTTPLPTCFMPPTGGGDTTVNDTTLQPTTVAVGPTASSVETEVTTQTLDPAAPLTTTRGQLNGTSEDIGTSTVNDIDSIT